MNSITDTIPISANTNRHRLLESLLTTTSSCWCYCGDYQAAVTANLPLVWEA